MQKSMATKLSPNTEIRVDCNEIVRRLTERNPQFKESIIEGKISLEDFAEIVVVQWKSFNRIL